MNKNYKLINSIFLLFQALDYKRRLQFFLILLINIINGLFEFLSIGSALLFLEVLTDPRKISSNFEFITSNLNFNNNSELLKYTTFIFLIITLLTTSVRILNLWLNTKYRISFLNYISNKIYKKIITQKYSFYIDNNSSDLLTDITYNIEKTNFFFENLLTLLTSLILSISIVISLLKLNIRITISSVIIFTILYGIAGIIINKKVDKFSKIEFNSNSNLIRNIQESLNAIKEIIISNNHNFYISNFKKNNNNLRRYQGYSGFITTFPRYLFEGIGIFFIGIAAFIINQSFNNSENTIALLGAFALGAQKLLPSMQSSYRSWSLLYFYDKALNRILSLFQLKENKLHSTKSKLNFSKEINIKNLSFSYSNKYGNISKNIDLNIRKGENIGIFGKTGSGKTTLINILMGLLTPISGEIYIDKTNLFKSKNSNILNSWKNNFAHVPQDVFLYDASILENIAFCIPKNKIDLNRVIEASKIACAHQFIIKTDKSYETLIGENGIKLSGGQKQRLGLARAIYSNSEILILDESTSALDSRTEKKVIESIFDKNINHSLTTITIAHRLSTLKFCDKIIEIRDGEIKKIYNNKEFLNEFQQFF